ncbi:AraC family transcriptional regulator ligand-binding domain-containing protein [Nocardia inohanensis]|uniref:AraC family transcriptional regulator ligand-binding domain-containing protein n=1 Tax=Nocardia inohanensis TaxID=209246 RepID=UPI00082D69CA|nr:AraC family transcriptional regulator ligand-binding domain-containing protein [Nocardia inohanensis]
MHTSDTVLMPRFILSRAAAAGIDPNKLARQAGMPDWLLSDSNARVPSHYYPRLWELLEHELGDPDTTLRVVGGYRVGELGLFDYLISTANTLGEGLGVVGPYVGAVSTNFRMDAGEQTETESTFNLYMINAEGHGRDLSVQSSLGILVSRIRQVTGRPIDPVRMTFQQRAPRSTAAFREHFGTAELDFAAPVNSMTYRLTDFELPQVTADPMLAAVLRRYAAGMPPPPPRATEWPDRVASVLEKALHQGDPALDEVARRLFTSARTLQRRLTESGTTWRLEVERARKRHLEQLESAAETP